MQRLYKPWPPRVVPEGLPEFLNTGSQGRIANSRVIPSNVKELLLSDQPSRLRGQFPEHAQGLRGDAYLIFAPPEPLGAVYIKWTEGNHRVVHRAPWKSVSEIPRKSHSFPETRICEAFYHPASVTLARRSSQVTAGQTVEPGR